MRTCEECTHWEYEDEERGFCNRLLVNATIIGFNTANFLYARGENADVPDLLTRKNFGCTEFMCKPKGPFCVLFDKGNGDAAYDLIYKGDYAITFPAGFFPPVRNQETIQEVADILNKIWLNTKEQQ
jgi:hypothetical protein